MVAVAGRGWKLAPSLVAFVLESDAAYPQRDRRSDGSIGDLAHQARVSDHNPKDGFVHAVDLDEDLAPGLDLKAFAEQLRVRRDDRIKYVIYEGRIFKSYVSSTGPAWTWLPYTGANAHLSHLHVSILGTVAARTDLSRWGFAPAPLSEEDEMSAADVAAIRKEIAAVKSKVEQTYNRVDEKVGGVYNQTVALASRLGALESAVSQLGAGGNVDYGKVQEAAEAAIKGVLGSLDER